MGEGGGVCLKAIQNTVLSNTFCIILNFMYIPFASLIRYFQLHLAVLVSCPCVLSRGFLWYLTNYWKHFLFLVLFNFYQAEQVLIHATAYCMDTWMTLLLMFNFTVLFFDSNCFRRDKMLHWRVLMLFHGDIWNFFVFPWSANIYLPKVNNGNTKKMAENSPILKVKTPVVSSLLTLALTY